jgi:hypothetical protein
METDTFEDTLRVLFEYHRDIQDDSRLKTLAEETARRYGLISAQSEDKDACNDNSDENQM